MEACVTGTGLLRILHPCAATGLGFTGTPLILFKSSLLIHVEQAFGMLVQRWGILWRPLSHNIVEKLSLPIVSVRMRLHNFAIDKEGSDSLVNSFLPLASICRVTGFVVLGYSHQFEKY